jgi:peptidoglycan lytic transglycosylase
VSTLFLASQCRRTTLSGLTLAVCLVLGLTVLPHASSAVAGPHLDQARQDSGLSAADIERYRTIFAVQADGDWAAADDLIAQLENDILLGHVLAQRYLHPTHYRSRYQELAQWLARYADHPDAPRLYRLALKRKPNGAKSPQRPVRVKTSLAAEPPLDIVYLYQSKKKLSRSERRKVARLKRRIRGYVRRTYLTKTERLLEQAEVRRLFDRFELDEAYSLVAAGWFYYGRPDKAYQLASAVAERSGAAIPTAYWTAGLAAWNLEKLGDAGRHFGHLAASEAAGIERPAPTGRPASMNVCRIRSRPIAGSPSLPASPSPSTVSWRNTASIFTST